ncbi:hypothetical protein ACOSQ3_013217 [Xanthoceras sorbifolium]
MCLPLSLMVERNNRRGFTVPSRCTKCKLFSHDVAKCHQNAKSTGDRGRSRSRNPNRNNKPSSYELDPSVTIHDDGAHCSNKDASAKYVNRAAVSDKGKAEVEDQDNDVVDVFPPIQSIPVDNPTERQLLVLDGGINSVVENQDPLENFSPSHNQSGYKFPFQDVEIPQIYSKQLTEQIVNIMNHPANISTQNNETFDNSGNNLDTHAAFISRDMSPEASTSSHTEPCILEQEENKKVRRYCSETCISEPKVLFSSINLQFVAENHRANLVACCFVLSMFLCLWL